MRIHPVISPAEVFFMAPVSVELKGCIMWDEVAVTRRHDSRAGRNGVVNSIATLPVHAVTVEQILKQKISKDVKKQLVKRFDKNGDNKISPTEFISKVVPNPMATLYACRPSSVSFQ